MNMKHVSQSADVYSRWTDPWIKHKLIHDPADWMCHYVFYILFSCDSEDAGIVRPSVSDVNQWLVWLDARELTVDVQRAKQYCINYIDC